MNKYIVEKNIAKACSAIETLYGSEKVKKSMRSKMSAFGASVLMSGPLSAIAYFNKNEVMIVKLLAKMYDKEDVNDLIEMFKKNTSDVDELIAKSVSLKLALNLFIDAESED